MKRRNRTTHHASKIRRKDGVCAKCAAKKHVHCSSLTCKCPACSRINWR